MMLRPWIAPSNAMTELLEVAFFQADPEHYEVQPSQCGLAEVRFVLEGDLLLAGCQMWVRLPTANAKVRRGL